MKNIILIMICSIFFSCVPKENSNTSENENIEVPDMEWIFNENIIGIYRFEDFTQFNFNSENTTQIQQLRSRRIYEEHFSEGAIIVGIENGKYYMQYSYPKYSKEYFDINFPVVSGSTTGGGISNYFEYRINNDIIEFYYNRIYEDRNDEYRNLLLSTGIFKQINITEHNIYQFSSYNIIIEQGKNIDLNNIFSAKVFIFNEENKEDYIVYYNNPDESINVVNTLNGNFIHYMGDSISSYEHKYYFQNNKLFLHVNNYIYRESADSIRHEYYIEFEKY